MKCAVTGASGYIGKQLVASLREHRHFVYELGRSAARMQNAECFLPFQLDNLQLPNLEGVDVLIHAAYDFTANTWPQSQAVNVNGSMRLLRHAKAQGVKRIILLSSMSSFVGAKSIYGKTKLMLEEQGASLGAIVIRPGLVFGRDTQGIVGAMQGFVKKFPVVPLIGLGKQEFYPCYVADLCQLLLRLLTAEQVTSEPITAAASKPMTFRQIVQVLAKAQHKRVLMVPVPFRFIWLGLKCLEALKINIGLRSDSLVGAQFFNKHPDFIALFSLVSQDEFCFRTLDPTLM